MPDTVAQSTSNSISGSGDSTRQRWRGSERLEKWSRTEADGDRLDMLGSESSKPPMNHILSAGAAPVNLKRLPWVACLRLVTKRTTAREVRRFPTTTQGLLELAEWLERT